MPTARQKDTALARLSSDMPALTVLSEQWQQRPDETSDQYWALMDWIDRGNKRGAPPKEHATTAMQQDWAGRCAAYDKAAELAQRAATTGRDQGTRITDNILLATELASAKLAKAEASSEHLVMSIKEIRDFMALIRQIQKEIVDTQLSATDLSVLSNEEMRQWLVLNEKIENSRSAKK